MIMNSVNNVNENRQRAHLELAYTVNQYLMSGGKVTVLKSKKNPKSRSVRVKEKLVFGTTEPKNRPCVMFDNVVMG